MSNKDWDKYIQIGCVIKIVKEKRNARRTGLLKDSYHKIVKPEGKNLNTHMQVYVKGANGKVIGVDYTEFMETPFTEIPNNTRRRRRK